MIFMCFVAFPLSLEAYQLLLQRKSDFLINISQKFVSKISIYSEQFKAHTFRRQRKLDKLRKPHLLSKHF